VVDDTINQAGVGKFTRQGTDSVAAESAVQRPEKVSTVDTPASVDRNAPVLAHHEIDISAPVSRVWALHQDVNAWPAWQSDITAAQLNGAFAPGGSFTWTSFGFTVTSTVYAVHDQSRVLWGGTGDGITGVHEWVFTATPAGAHVETTESFAGAPVEADVAGMQRVLDAAIASLPGRTWSPSSRSLPAAPEGSDREHSGHESAGAPREDHAKAYRHWV
jgi:hypothetical protein